MDAADQVADICVDELASRAREAISSIVEVLVHHPTAQLVDAEAVALALSALVECGELDGAAVAERIADERDAIVRAIAETALPLRLHEGLYGAIWTLGQLGEDVDTSEVRAILAAQLRKRIAAGAGARLRIDLIDGVVGLGVYALDHDRDAIATIVELLELCAVRHDAGIVWAKPAAWSRERGWHELAPGHVDVGMAHGIAGVVAWLAQVVSTGLGDARTRLLLADAVAGLRSLALRGPESDVASYPAIVGPDFELRPARLAWCYGDLGVASALFAAARALGDATLEREALTLASGAARREPSLAGVESAGICHGAGGLAWMLLRLYQRSGEPELARLARRWWSHALDLRQPGRGLAGYLARDELSGAWTSDRGLLEGISGIALTLLGALGQHELRWDRYFLLQASS